MFPMPQVYNLSMQIQENDLQHLHVSLQVELLLHQRIVSLYSCSLSMDDWPWSKEMTFPHHFRSVALVAVCTQTLTVLLFYTVVVFLGA